MVRVGTKSQHYPQNPMSGFDHFCQCFAHKTFNYFYISQGLSAIFVIRVDYVARLKLKYFQSCLLLVCCHGDELKLSERGHLSAVPLLPGNETFVTSLLTDNTYPVKFRYTFLRDTTLIL